MSIEGIGLVEEASAELCIYSCWKYGTERCPYNAIANREVDTCQYESGIGALDMTEEQVELQEKHLAKIGCDEETCSFTRTIRREHGIGK